MKKFIYYLLILFLLIPLNVSASNPKELIAMDMESKRVLYTNNATEKSLIASITKIMTSVVTMDNINVNKTVTAKDEVLKMYGSNIYIEYGEKMKVKDLLYGLLLRSGNELALTE